MQTITNQTTPDSFWDRIAEKYANKPIADPSAYEEKLESVRSLLCRSDKILEIGCGSGSTAIRLASHVARVTATDVSRVMIDIARRKLDTTSNRNVSFEKADASAINGSGPFDVVCAFSLLHLVDNVPRVLSSVRNQLKPNGLFISKTVCLKDGILAVRLFVRVLTAMGITPKVKELSRAELVRLIKSAGFEIERVTHFGDQKTNPFIVARLRENLSSGHRNLVKKSASDEDC